MENFKTERFKIAFDLYNKEDFAALFEFCKAECPNEVENVELWKLFSVGAGMSNHPKIALMASETVFKIDADSFGNLINLLTAYFHNDMAESAIDLLYSHEDMIHETNIQYIIDLIIEASNQYCQDDLINALPEVVKEMIMAKIQVA